MSVLPLDRTAHGRKLLFWPVACFGHLFHRFKQVATSIRDRRHARGIEPTAVLQFVLYIEAEEVGCALSAIGMRNLLGRVEDVGEA